jgi:hypothetical protein
MYADKHGYGRVLILPNRCSSAQIRVHPWLAFFVALGVLVT